MIIHRSGVVGPRGLDGNDHSIFTAVALSVTDGTRGIPMIIHRRGVVSQRSTAVMTIHRRGVPRRARR